MLQAIQNTEATGEEVVEVYPPIIFKSITFLTTSDVTIKIMKFESTKQTT